MSSQVSLSGGQTNAIYLYVVFASHVKTIQLKSKELTLRYWMSTTNVHISP